MCALRGAKDDWHKACESANEVLKLVTVVYGIHDYAFCIVFAVLLFYHRVSYDDGTGW